MTAPSTNNRTTTRVQVEMPESSMERLRRLQDRTEAVSYAQVMKNALQLYEAIVEEQDRGTVISLRRPDGKEIELKILV